MKSIKQSLMWLDLETTALKPEDGQIIEVFAAFESANALDAAGVHGIVNCNPYRWPDSAIEMHGDLIALCENSEDNLMAIEDALIEYVRKHGFSASDVERDRRINLAGFSVHFDLKWIQVHMPRFSRYVHYRVFDVSTIRTFFIAAGCGDIVEQRERAHRAKEDAGCAFLAYQAAVKRLTK